MKDFLLTSQVQASTHEGNELGSTERCVQASKTGRNKKKKSVVSFRSGSMQIYSVSLNLNETKARAASKAYTLRTLSRIGCYICTAVTLGYHVGIDFERSRTRPILLSFPPVFPFARSTR